MNTRDIRIAIAEANGREWTMENHLESGYHSWQDFADQCGDEVLDDELPDYCNDLNAMHEVEKTLNDVEYLSYVAQLKRMAQIFGPHGRWITDDPHIIHSTTALQRAEAYLRTIGKWNENAGTNV